MASKGEPSQRSRRIFSDLASGGGEGLAVERIEHGGEHGGARLAWATLLVALAATLALWWFAAAEVRREADLRFQNRVNEVHAAIQQRMQAYAQVMRSAAAMLQASPEVSRDDWQSFIGSLELDLHYPGIPAVAFARYVQDAEVDALVRAVRAEGVPEFAVRPPGRRDTYVVNVFAAPFNALNRKALGYDMLSDPPRRAAILKALETGQPAITSKLTLKVDEEHAPQPAFIMYLPVFKRGLPAATADERRAAVWGFVLAPFRVHPLLGGIIGPQHDELRLTIHDGTGTAPEQEMYHSPGDGPEEARARAGLTETRVMVFHDRPWTVTYESTTAFDALVDTGRPNTVAGAGGLISLLLFAITWNLSTTRARAARLAARMTESLHRREAELHQFFTQAPVGIAILDAEGRVLDCNPVLGAFMGVPAEQVIGFNMVTQARDQSLAPAIRTALTGQPVEMETQYVSTLGGRSGYYLVHLQPVFDGGQFLFLLAFIDDVTERRAVEQRVQYLAHYDALTGLPNRTLLQDRLALAIAGARRNGTTVAVLFLDLDHFKVINDSLGHTVGDEVLKDVAVRLRQCLREGDTVGRLGGDEFIIVLPEAGTAQDVAVVADRIIQSMAAPLHVKGREFTVSPSIGISLFPEDGEDVEHLIKNADAAMYQAKAAGRRALRFFTTSMDAQLNERLNLEANIRRALDLGEFRLHYQPQLHLESGQLVGLEALIRWAHPDLGMVPPGRFIPIAEESGQIASLSLWVLDEACRQASLWQADGLAARRIAVNISALQFRNAELPDQVAAALQRHDLHPSCLEVEVTEGALIRNVDMAIHILSSLKTMGVRVSIDDFGTGYSSLSYLQRFPVDTLKIDRSFISEIGTDDSDAAITKAIIGLGSNLGLTVIAEGVETEPQLDFLRRHGCHGAQGYLFSPPLPAEEITRFLRSRTAVAAADD
ncbi:MAG TPA: EAL domain-containing protein [Azospirillum sp.]|nr:EAL domain-containing protein [Azospirillum sp.]